MDEATAREAAALIEVEYEVLDSIHDMKKGLEDVDEPIHWKVNITPVQRMSKEVFKNSVTVQWLKIQTLYIMENGNTWV